MVTCSAMAASLARSESALTSSHSAMPSRSRLDSAPAAAPWSVPSSTAARSSPSTSKSHATTCSSVLPVYPPSYGAGLTNTTGSPEVEPSRAPPRLPAPSTIPTTRGTIGPSSASPASKTRNSSQRDRSSPPLVSALSNRAPSPMQTSGSNTGLSAVSSTTSVSPAVYSPSAISPWFSVAWRHDTVSARTAGGVVSNMIACGPAPGVGAAHAVPLAASSKPSTCNASRCSPRSESGTTPSPRHASPLPDTASWNPSPLVARRLTVGCVTAQLKVSCVSTSVPAVHIAALGESVRSVAAATRGRRQST
mmetsp:Transcript_14091/g.44104  ORF Transcript_14091/g.44104 Transcript_14091/m.44104 type:complete len:307 (-) Transcript_14091:36-956(-)